MTTKDVMKKARDAALIPFQKRCIDPTHHRVGYAQNDCVNCLADYFLAFRKEGLEEAIHEISQWSDRIGGFEAQHLTQAIRKLEE